jgi:hypothetical protein
MKVRVQGSSHALYCIIYVERSQEIALRMLVVLLGAVLFYSVLSCFPFFLSLRFEEEHGSRLPPLTQPQSSVSLLPPIHFRHYPALFLILLRGICTHSHRLGRQFRCHVLRHGKNMDGCSQGVDLAILL